MSEERPGPSGSWLRRLVESLTGGPRDVEQLSDVLDDARDRGLIDADVLAMLEGVLQVSEIQVRDVMVPRSQMVVVHRDDSPEKILPLVIESGHSRFPVVGEDRDEVAGRGAGGRVGVELFDRSFVDGTRRGRWTARDRHRIQRTCANRGRRVRRQPSMRSACSGQESTASSHAPRRESSISSIRMYM